MRLYYYFMDREFGLIHLKLQTWFPMTMQVYVNSQEWLARKLRANGVGFTKLDSVFLDVEDVEPAQQTTQFGRHVMATAIQIRELNLPQLLALAA